MNIRSNIRTHRVGQFWNQTKSKHLSKVDQLSDNIACVYAFSLCPEAMRHGGYVFVKMNRCGGFQVESDHMNNASILDSCDGIERVMWIVCV